jgi:hypothetical protein
VHHVGTKLNEGELAELEALALKRGVTHGELIRGLILGEVAREKEPAPAVRPSVELEEITVLRLLLTNVLPKLATGETMTLEAYKGIAAEMKPPLRTKSIGTKVSEAEFAALEARARGVGLTLSEWVRAVLLAMRWGWFSIQRTSKRHSSFGRVGPAVDLSGSRRTGRFVCLPRSAARSGFEQHLHRFCWRCG